MSKRIAKPYTRMTTRELAEATKDLNRVIRLEETEPMTAAERAEWERHAGERRGRGRPKIGAGAVRLPICLEGGLAERLEAFAERIGAKRSQVIALALELLMADSKTSSARSVADVVARIRALNPHLSPQAGTYHPLFAGDVGFAGAAEPKRRRRSAG
jgi:hypothetical protein